MRLQLKRRKLMEALAGTGVVGSIAGCGSAGETEDTPTQSPGDGGTGQTETTGTGSPIDTEYVEAWTEPVSSLHPLNLLGISDYYFMRRLWERPFYVAQDGSIQPWLCTDHEVNSDATEYTYTVREDVKWHDGESLTAEDLAFTLVHIHDQSYPVINQPLTRVLDAENVRATDDRTVVVPLTQPYPTLTLDLADFINIIPKHIWSEIEDPEDFFVGAEYPTGTGPFTLEDYEREEFYNFSVNEDYWRELPEDVTAHTARIIGNTDTRNLSLRNGDVDGFNLTDFGSTALRIDSHENTDLFQIDPAALFAVYFNTQHPDVPVEVRQAVATAIPVQKIIDSVFAGVPDIATSSMPAALKPWHTDDVNTWDLDRERAKTILRDAGYEQVDNGWNKPNGEPLNLSVTIENVGVSPRLSGIIKTELSKIGLPLSIQNRDPNTYTQEVLVDKEFKMTINGVGWFLDPLFSLDFWYKYHGTGPDSAEGFRIINFSKYKSDRFNELHDEALETVDDDERKNLIDQLQQVLAEELPTYPITYAGPFGFWGMNTKEWNGEKASQTLQARYGFSTEDSYGQFTPNYE